MFTQSLRLCIIPRALESLQIFSQKSNAEESELNEAKSTILKLNPTDQDTGIKDLDLDPDIESRSILLKPLFNMSLDLDLD